jgi:hypothetical protein
MHSTFMHDRNVHEHVIKFLTEGHFDTAETRQPIE